MMSPLNDNRDRLETEGKNLLALAEKFANVSVESKDSAGREYQIRFSVQSVADLDASSRSLTMTDHQEVEICLPLAYPQDPPQMRWLTPIFHPNVSLSGYLDVADIGLEWSPEMSLVVVCERLWDIARFAWVDLEAANNYAARKHWREGRFDLPTDPRPFREDVTEKLKNVIHYQSKHASRESVVPPATAAEPAEIYSIADSGPGSPGPTTSSSTDSELIAADLVEIVDAASPAGTDESAAAGSEGQSDASQTDESSRAGPPPAGDVDESESSLFVIDEQSAPAKTPTRKKGGDDDLLIIE